MFFNLSSYNLQCLLKALKTVGARTTLLAPFPIFFRGWDSPLFCVRPRPRRGKHLLLLRGTSKEHDPPQIFPLRSWSQSESLFDKNATSSRRVKKHAPERRRLRTRGPSSTDPPVLQGRPAPAAFLLLVPAPALPPALLECSSKLVLSQPREQPRLLIPHHPKRISNFFSENFSSYKPPFASSR